MRTVKRTIPPWGPASTGLAALGLAAFLPAACGMTSDPAPASGPVDGRAATNGDGGGAFDGPDTPPRDLSDAGPIVATQTVSPNIVVDQFGYLPVSEKIAVVRSPQTGFDRAQAFTPGGTYALVDAHSGDKLLEAAPAAWNGGATDASSGDKAGWFDFSSVTTPGDYFVLDEKNDVRSVVFRLSTQVYRGALVAAVRMLYYQRDGIAKDARYAGAEWADGMAHPQSAHCGLYSDGSSPKDVHGGWFDAGDQNKYANWAADDVTELLRAYVESPGAFTDDTNIPESGNGVPDVLDELKWELDWLGRMQNADGSVLSVVTGGSTSPPSLDTSPCRYGPASTSATLTAAGAFAYASLVFKAAPAMDTAYPGYAAALAAMATRAWTWANANPSVTFYNAQHGVAAGEQEVDASARTIKKVEAAVMLFELTGQATYKSVVDANVQTLLANLDPFHMVAVDAALEYTRAPGATASVTAGVLASFKAGVEGGNGFGKHAPAADPFLAYLQAYTWGSNQVKAAQGNLFEDVAAFHVDAAAEANAGTYAARYVHYLHGVNPLGLVYLSNMASAGAERSVTRFYHSWFGHGTAWDAAGVSAHGPPPGYLVGGPNPSYAWDGCCPSGCGSPANDALCGAASPAPPTMQPAQKAFKDFNDAWPLDSWSVTEPSDTYQTQYIRLLAKLVAP